MPVPFFDEVVSIHTHIGSDMRVTPHAVIPWLHEHTIKPHQEKQNNKTKALIERCVCEHMQGCGLMRTLRRVVNGFITDGRVAFLSVIRPLRNALRMFIERDRHTERSHPPTLNEHTTHPLLIFNLHPTNPSEFELGRQNVLHIL